LAERNALYLWNEEQQEHDARMEANRRYEDAMKEVIAKVEEFDQSLSLADVLSLNALGVKVSRHSRPRGDRPVADVLSP
jgi:hypothetical protein